MYAQCPECLTIYKLRAEALAAARGRARCGSCGAEFDTLATLVDELPPEPFNTLKRRPGSAPLPQLNMPAARPPSQQRELFVGFDDARARRDPAPPPSFARASTRAAIASAPRAGWGWTAGSLLLLATLGSQLAWAFREPLLAEPGVLAAASAACERLGCSLPVVADRSRIVLMARDVRPHPSVPNALIISATVSNDAPFAQPYPVVEITLSDVNEKRIALRRFAPAEYVGDLRAIGRGLPAGGTASLNLEVEDPGNNAVAFEFRFL
ncbi:MAG: DUF3426 domain-containing protein [Xanthomonadaceae bacterium]|jgi:predicted Zn finger-like uncharacterized protein|nr:DUF3426 domain-containing protein [Xanthomonadaceae bacterium]